MKNDFNGENQSCDEKDDSKLNSSIDEEFSNVDEQLDYKLWEGDSEEERKEASNEQEENGREEKK